MPAASASASAFIEDTFQAVLTLLEDARDHVAAGMAPDLAAPQRMRAAQELSRLTNRATAAMSLLLLAKALEAGQEVGQGADPAGIAGKATAILADISAPPSPVVGGADVAVPADLAALVARGETLFAHMPRVVDHVRGLVEPV